MPHAAAWLSLVGTLAFSSTALEGRAQDRFSAPIGPRQWVPSDSLELPPWRRPSLPNLSADERERAEAARRRAFDAAGIDPDILIYPDTLVDASMVLRPPEEVDPKIFVAPRATPWRPDTSETDTTSAAPRRP